MRFILFELWILQLCTCFFVFFLAFNATSGFGLHLAWPPSESRPYGLGASSKWPSSLTPMRVSMASSSWSSLTPPANLGTAPRRLPRAKQRGPGEIRAKRNKTLRSLCTRCFSVYAWNNDPLLFSTFSPKVNTGFYLRGRRSHPAARTSTTWSERNKLKADVRCLFVADKRDLDKFFFIHRIVTLKGSAPLER